MTDRVELWGGAGHLAVRPNCSVVTRKEWVGVVIHLQLDFLTGVISA